jgi:hypothetical protein
MTLNWKNNLVNFNTVQFSHLWILFYRKNFIIFQFWLKRIELNSLEISLTWRLRKAGDIYYEETLPVLFS